MRDLAPGITRQRLLIEGLYTVDIDAGRVEGYLQGLAAHVGLRTYGRGVVLTPPGGEGRDENQGFDAFLPLIDSGISVYVWTAARFVATVLFTCKRFAEDAAVDFARDFLGLSDVEAQSF